MKKRKEIAIALLAISIVATGCSKDKNSPDDKKQDETATQAANDNAAYSGDDNADNNSDESDKDDNANNAGANQNEDDGVKKDEADASQQKETPSIEEQIRCIADNKNKWFEADDEGFSYAVTDLDYNGMLEIIASKCEGSGMYSTNHFYKVNDNADGIDEIEYDMGKDSEPDLVSYWVDHYENYDEGKSENWFIFQDVYKDGTNYSYVSYAMSLKDGKISYEKLGYKTENYDNNVETTKFYNAEGKELTMEEYEAIIDKRFSLYVCSGCYFGWYASSAIEDVSTFAKDSYDVYLSRNSQWGITGDFQVDVFINENSEEFNDYNGEVIAVNCEATGNSKIRFMSQTDGVTVKLQKIQWFDGFNCFEPVEDVFTIQAEAGKMYEFSGTIAETIPQYRLYVENEGYAAEWTMQYDGENAADNHEIRYEEAQIIKPEKDDPVMDLCKAYAGMVITAGSADNLKESYIWQTTANAVMLNTLKYSDADSEGNVYIDKWMLDKFTKALFPYEYIDDNPNNNWVKMLDNQVIVSNGMFYDDSTVSIEAINVDDYGRIEVMVNVKTQMGDETVVVYLVNDMNVISDNPFGYYITNAEISVG